MTSTVKFSSSVIHQQKFKCSSTLIIGLILFMQISPSDQHGRLIEPPSRASAWRYGFSTPANYNDHELFCGGFTRQHQTNKGKCGECGDAWDLPTPRPHEYGGAFGQGVTVRKYNPGSPVTIRIELTASHMGYFEFRLCDDINARQTCLDKNLLKVISGTPFVKTSSDLETRFYPRNGSRIYEIKAQLPKKLECEHCVLQWKYIAGNNWGICPDGNGAVGCGDQEEFRACADVAIGKGAASAIPTIKPPTRKPTTDKWPTDEPNVEENEVDIDNDDSVQKPPQNSNFFGAVIAIFTFFLVLCSIAAIYIYFYHGDLLKQMLSRQRSNVVASAGSQQKTPLHFVTPTTFTLSPSAAATIEPTQIPPTRPPRTKRLSQTLQDVHNDHATIIVSNDKNVSDA